MTLPGRLPDALAAFAEALAARGVEANSDLVLDALWLASQWSRAAPVERSVAPLVNTVEGDTVERPAAPPREAAASEGSSSAPKTDEPKRELPVLAQRSGESDMPLRVATPRWLKEPLRLHRALKPLKKRLPSRALVELDEGATVEFIAQSNLWIPIMRPKRTRWLDLVLVFDGARSLSIWTRLAGELVRFFSLGGVFARVGVWTLDTEGSLTLHKGRGAGRVRAPLSRVDNPGRRQLILVVTDGVSSGWQTAALARWFEERGRQAPISILELLPSDWWVATALPKTLEWFTSQRPGAPNRHYETVRSRRSRARSAPATGLRVPIVTLDPASLEPWARAIAGQPAALLRGVRLTALEANEARSATPIGPSERWERFKAASNPRAVKLARLFSVVPLTLPIMLLTMEVAAPECGPSDLVEFLYGGLLRMEATTQPEPEIEFRDGVRELALAELPEWQRAALFEATSRRVASLEGGANGYVGWLHNGASSDGARRFASIARHVAKSLGQRYDDLFDMGLRPVERATRAAALLSTGAGEKGAAMGSAVLLTPGLVLTAAHVNRAGPATLRFGGSEEVYPLDPECFDVEVQVVGAGRTDLQYAMRARLVATRREDHERLRERALSSHPMEAGVPLALGAKLIVPFFLGTPEQHIAQTQVLELAPPRVAYSATGGPGASGAPLFNQQGNLAAIVVGSDTRGRGVGVLYTDIFRSLHSQLETIRELTGFALPLPNAEPAAPPAKLPDHVNPTKAATSDLDNYLLVRKSFVLSYNNRLGRANWVSFPLVERDLSGPFKRKAPERVIEDPDLPPGITVSRPVAFRGTGFNRAYFLSPSERTADEVLHAEVYLMSNVVPLPLGFTLGPFKAFTDYYRQLARTGAYLLVCVGATGDAGPINPDVARPRAPVAMWKAVFVYDDRAPGKPPKEVLAVFVPLEGFGSQAERVPPDAWRGYSLPLKELEGRAGVQFPKEFHVAPIVERGATLSGKTRRKPSGNTKKKPVKQVARKHKVQRKKK
ncbi:MAG: SAV_2336 N-terminal domain-related protein [Polyangiaceae bacterium]